jgi:sulfopyruvate decarboxylase TPP-binding subunit
MSAATAYEAVKGAGTELVTAVPDSLLTPLCRLAADHPAPRYVQTTDEATAIGIAAGAHLAGLRSMVIMENSGLRRGCETLARLTMSHRLHCVMLISRRGAFGEANWWGLPHEETMHAHLAMLPVSWTEVNTSRELGPALDRAYATLATGQRSVVLVANPSFTDELRVSP